MAFLERLHPSNNIPKLVTPQTPNVDFNKYVGENTRYADLADAQAYLTAITNIDTESSVGQQWSDDLARQNYTIGQVGAPYYLIRALIEYDAKEDAQFSKLNVGVSLNDFLQRLARQAINQRRHQAILWGFDENQGILANVTKETLPADSKGNKTLVTYQINELQAFLSSLALKVLDNSLNLAKPAVVASSIRVINYLKTALISSVSLLNNTIGIDSVASVYNRVIGQFLGVGEVTFIADDLLKGDTSDKLIILSPGLSQAEVTEEISQNLVGGINSATFNTFYDSSANGLTSYLSPSRMGKYEELLSYQMTPGITLRKECVIEVDLPYNVAP